MNVHRLPVVFLLIVFCLAACGGNSDSPQNQTFATPTPTPVPVYIESWRKIDSNYESAITGINYPVHIFLPADYQHENAQQKNYPVIYATDGQWIFDSFANILERKGYSAILVAIEQGPNDRRATDYLMPGAEDYFGFLTSELMPSIESDYRVDTNKRTLSGTSYGGLFTGTVLVMDDVSDPLFKNILSFDASFWKNWTTTTQLEQARYNASDTMNITLVLTAATGTQGNQTSVNRFQTLLQNRAYNGLKIYRQDYDLVHEAMADPSFDYAVGVLLGQP